MKTLLTVMMSLVVLVALASPAAAQYSSPYAGSCYSGSCYSGYYTTYRSTYKFEASTYVYDYPKVDYVVVPAYALAPAVAVQPAVLPPAVTTATPAVPEGVQPVAGPGTVPAVVYLQPAQVYSIGYVPVYRTRYQYHK